MTGLEGSWFNLHELLNIIGLMFIQPILVLVFVYCIAKIILLKNKFNHFALLISLNKFLIATGAYSFLTLTITLLDKKRTIEFTMLFEAFSKEKQLDLPTFSVYFLWFGSVLFFICGSVLWVYHRYTKQKVSDSFYWIGLFYYGTILLPFIFLLVLTLFNTLTRL